MNRRIPEAIIGLLFLGVCTDCSVIASSDLKTGIGMPCASADDCQGGVCDQGLCSHECTANENCPDPSICVGGLCKLGCLGDTACSAGQICEGNVCRLGCRVDDVCGSGQICIDLACIPGCRGDTACATGNICEANTCISGCRKDADCGEASAAKICENKTCTAGCRDDTWCVGQPDTICTDLACVTGCRLDDACGKGNICEANACTPGCRNTEGCPDGNYCDQGQCKPTLAVAAVFTGDSTRPAEDGLTASHKLGLDQAATAAPYVLFGQDHYRITNNATTPEDVDAAIDAAVTAGAKVIVTTTLVSNARALIAASKYPNVKFVTTSSRDNDQLPNVGAYSGKTDQHWYAAGKLAAREADKGTKCIGLVLPTPTKQIVRETNAFSRGAASFDPAIKVVVRWLGGTKDRDPSGLPTYSYKATNYQFDSAQDGKLYREELLAAQLADLGCTLIGHRTESQRVISFIDAIANRVNVAKPVGNRNLFSLGVDVKDACRENVTASGKWFGSCLGVPYWNWGPMYTKLFDDMYNNVWTAKEVRYEFQVGASGIMKFELSPYTTATGIASADADNVMAAVANAGWDAVFKGPYSFNGQRDLNRDGIADTNQNVSSGIPLAEEELDRMCWFVQGVYELPKYSEVDYTTVIPAMVPYGPEVVGQVTTVDSSAASQQKYGDVSTFITTKLSQNPSEIMSCPLN